MKRRVYCLVVLSFLIFAIFASCGGVFEDVEGQPGGSGSKDTGSLVDIEVEPVYMDDVCYNVDCSRDPDCNNDGTLDDPEPFQDHDAQVTAINRHLPGSEENGSATTIYLERVTIEFSSPNPAAPAIGRRDVALSVVIPAPDSGETEKETKFTVPFVDLRAKAAFAAAYAGGSPQRYNAHYTFYGVNEYGHEVELEADVWFTMGDFDNCS